MKIDPVGLLQNLIRCPSVTPHDEGCLDIIQKTLEPLGFSFYRLPFGGDDLEAADNLYAQWGNKGPNFCFAGHTDVVPPGDINHWTTDPFGGEIRDGLIYGRGAVDMKGGIAAFISAVSEVITKDSPDCSFSLLLTSDEEGPATFGTKKVIEWLKEKGKTIDFCLVGEPTNPQILGETAKIGSRGSLNTKITTVGKRGHVAYPHFALNPLPPLLNYLNELLREPLDEGTDSFIASNLEVTSLDVGNLATNVIPEKATAQFNIRFNPLHTGKSLTDFLRNKMQSMSQSYSQDLKWQLDPTISGEAFITKNDTLQSMLADSIQSVTGLIPQFDTSGGTSDARFLKDICPVIEFGLISDQAHQIDEHVSVKDILSLTAIYQKVLQKVASNTGGSFYLS